MFVYRCPKQYNRTTYKVPAQNLAKDRGPVSSRIVDHWASQPLNLLIIQYYVRQSKFIFIEPTGCSIAVSVIRPLGIPI